MKRLDGIAAAKGIVIGPAWVYHPEIISVDEHPVADGRAEMERFHRAVDRARGQLVEIQRRAAERLGAEQAAIFEAHAMFLEDEALIGEIENHIRAGTNAEAALARGIEKFARELAALTDAYFRERATDIRDVGQRVLRSLAGVDNNSLAALDAPAIIIAVDLTPSETAMLDKALTLGFATARGGTTSHTAILARCLGLPAVVGLGDTSLDAIGHGTLIVMDGEAGVVIVDPDAATLAEYRRREREWRAGLESVQAGAQATAETRDGHRVEVVANINSVESAKSALAFGAQGVGLLRTELLFLERRSLPDEEDQYALYHAIAEVMGDRPVIVRTLDIGGDKPPPYMEWVKELNPFLGWRAIRVSLSLPDMFKTQLRAILRAGAGHRIRIMFPMIATVEELRQARGYLDQARSELDALGVAYARDTEVGIMIEIPSAATLARFLAREVDFFSIGTNDLIQYTFAADRTNEHVSYLYEPLHPAILQVIQRIIDDAHAAGKRVGMCGEMASDLNAVPVLLGMGLDEFSMSAASIPDVKELIRSLDFATMQALVGKVLEMGTAAEVKALVSGTRIG